MKSEIISPCQLARDHIKFELLRAAIGWHTFCLSDYDYDDIKDSFAFAIGDGYQPVDHDQKDENYRYLLVPTKAELDFKFKKFLIFYELWGRVKRLEREWYWEDGCVIPGPIIGWI